MKETIRNTARMTVEFVAEITALGFIEETHTVNGIETIDWVYKFDKMEISIDAWGDTLLTQDGYDEIPISFVGIMHLEGIVEFFDNLK